MLNFRRVLWWHGFNNGERLIIEACKATTKAQQMPEERKIFKWTCMKIYFILNASALIVFSPLLLPGNKFTGRNVHRPLWVFLFIYFSYLKENRREDSWKTNSDVINIWIGRDISEVKDLWCAQLVPFLRINQVKT